MSAEGLRSARVTHVYIQGEGQETHKRHAQKKVSKCAAAPTVLSVSQLKVRTLVVQAVPTHWSRELSYLSIMSRTLVMQICALVLVVLVAAVTARPDSAGIVEMVDGFAYGGIPYGSVTGQVAEFYKQRGGVGDLELGRTLYDDFLTFGNFIIG